MSCCILWWFFHQQTRLLLLLLMNYDDADDASQFDVVVPHPEHLLLINLGPCSTTKSVL